MSSTTTTRTRRPRAAKVAAPVVPAVPIRKEVDVQPELYVMKRGVLGTEVDTERLGKQMDKAPSALHDDFVRWIAAEVGYAADPKTVQIVCALRMEYQRSEANQASLKARRDATAAKKAAAIVRKAAAAKKALDGLNPAELKALLEA